jgi:hypothetical protein
MNTPVKEIVMSSPALKHLSEIYPPNRYGKVPLKIKMACTVKSDLPIFMQPKSDVVAYEGQEYFVWCNSHGAMSAILPNGEKLGIRPSECEIVEWHS